MGTFLQLLPDGLSGSLMPDGIRQLLPDDKMAQQKSGHVMISIVPIICG